MQLSGSCQILLDYRQVRIQTYTWALISPPPYGDYHWVYLRCTTQIWGELRNRSSVGDFGQRKIAYEGVFHASKIVIMLTSGEWMIKEANEPVCIGLQCIADAIGEVLGTPLAELLNKQGQQVENKLNNTPLVDG